MMMMVVGWLTDREERKLCRVYVGHDVHVRMSGLKIVI